MERSMDMTIFQLKVVEDSRSIAHVQVKHFADNY